MSKLSRGELLKLTGTAYMHPNDAELKLEAIKLCLDNGTLAQSLKSLAGDLPADTIAVVLKKYSMTDVVNAVANEGMCYLNYRIGMKDSPAPERGLYKLLRTIFEEQPAVLEQLRRDIYKTVNASIDARLGNPPYRS